ncbi:P-loop containing nucleoside triphosphate hydrolase [Synechococcus sp. BIOS-E4-1]|uniref:ATP-binding domain-containing protein n=1 Tax=Synechococcus sp. BIOS-E4-1 TaxID=1400864 RepID=UPI0016468EE0|nr:ATP-binding domain-containing protein [Synechococcus sp. BIOS-E4-1]QNI53978.1 P-loop containing nucleoside triphosphate hydrolase [Synechococcus sp. BIOS-E4-1]
MSFIKLAERSGGVNTAGWIPTAELCRYLSMSRQSIDKLRRSKPPLFHPGIHFIAKGSSPNAGFLWHAPAVVKSLAAQADKSCTPDQPEMRSHTFRSSGVCSADHLNDEQHAGFASVVRLIQQAKSSHEPGKDTSVLAANISGYSGTGKSTVTAAIVRWCEWYFKNPRTAIECIAPTHKAANELRNKLEDNGCKHLEVTTLTKFLGKKKIYDNQGNRDFVVKPSDLPYTDPDLRVVFLDELSMIPDSDLELLVERLCKRTEDKDYPRKHAQIVLIGIGDPRQLYPVKGTSSIFNPGDAESPWPADLWDVRVKLENVVRHSGPVLSLATAVRQHGLSGRPAMVSDPGDGTESSVAVLHSSEWISSWLDYLKKQDSGGRGEYDVQCLAYRNATVNKLNTMARDHLYGPGAEPFQPGERLLSTDAIMCPLDEVLLCGSATEITVLQTRSTVHDFDGERVRGYEIQGFMPQIKNEYDISKDIEFLALHPADQDLMERVKKRRKDKALALQKQKNDPKGKWNADLEDSRRYHWRKYYEAAEFFSPVEPGYCMTVHKSQGSTYRTVFVDMLDLDCCKKSTDLNRLTYVAVSRASHELFIRQ